MNCIIDCFGRAGKGRKRVRVCVDNLEYISLVWGLDSSERVPVWPAGRKELILYNLVYDSRSELVAAQVGKTKTSR